MPIISTPEPGVLIMYVEPGATSPTLQLVTGETAPKEAKRRLMNLLTERQGAVRVFYLLEVFNLTGEIARIVVDDWAPALDLILREQLAGKGVQAKRRGPPREKPQEFFDRVRAEKEARPAPEEEP